MSFRDDIWSLFYQHKNGVLNREESVDATLRIIREYLTSDEAIDAMIEKHAELVLDQLYPDETWQGFITAAIDKVL